MNEEKNLKTSKKPSSGLPDYMWIASLGINLVVSSAVGSVLGFFLDKWLNTKPIFMIFLFFVGLFAGFRQIFKEIKKIDKETK